MVLGGVRFDQLLANFKGVSLRGNLGVTAGADFMQPPAFGPTGVYGGGGTMGIEFTTKRIRTVQPDFDGGIGCLVFQVPVPLLQTRRFNFEAYLGPGIRLPRQRLRFNVWLLHFSNAATASRNPGVDSLILSVAYTLFNRK